MLTVGLIADVHIGPSARFDGKLRKLSAQAPELLGRFVDRMRDEVRPDLVVNLGDIIQDEEPAIDAERYQQGLGLLRQVPGELVNVAGNHDRYHLSEAQLRSMWGASGDGRLYRSFDLGGHHFVVLYTHEQKDEFVTVDAEQLAWLEADLKTTVLPTVVFMHHSAADQDLADNRWFARDRHIALVRERAELRTLLSRYGRTIVVVNGHLHWNHLYVAEGIPYVTLQSLVENVEEDAPGRAAAAHGVMRLAERSVCIEIAGQEPARYQFERSGQLGRPS